MGLQRVGSAAALALTLGSSGAALAAPMQIVVLGGLDKVTAHVSTFEVPVGKTVTFGALQITARACDKHPPEETPESAAFLEVIEARPGETPHQLFSGWMFASSRRSRPWTTRSTISGCWTARTRSARRGRPRRRTAP